MTYCLYLCIILRNEIVIVYNRQGPSLYGPSLYGPRFGGRVCHGPSLSWGPRDVPESVELIEHHLHEAL